DTECIDADEPRHAFDLRGEVTGGRGRVVVRAASAPAAPRVDDGAAGEPESGVRGADAGPARARELAGRDHVAIARRGRVEPGERDERPRTGGRGEAGARAAARIGVVPEVPVQMRALARERKVVLS